MKRLLVLLTALAVTLSLAGCGADTKESRTGDTMATYFFEFTVNSAALTNDYEGYTPAEGNALLVAEVTVKNTFKESIEMYDADFQLGWGDEDDAFAYPITINTETMEELEPVGENQLPGTYTLAVDEERTGDLVFEVPVGQADFSIGYREMFDDGSEDGQSGDTHFVYFTAKEMAE